MAAIGGRASSGTSGSRSVLCRHATTASGTGTTATSAVEDVVVNDDDFKPLAETTAVRGFFVDNVAGDLDATLAVANDPAGGAYPVGTVIQLIPQEAMVKRAPGFDPDSNEWEFFTLEVTAAGTKDPDAWRQRGDQPLQRHQLRGLPQRRGAAVRLRLRGRPRKCAASRRRRCDHGHPRCRSATQRRPGIKWLMCLRAVRFGKQIVRILVDS